MAHVPRISASLTDGARRGWSELCERYGVSLTAVLEATGQKLDDTGGKLLDDVEAVIDLARKIDRDRQAR